MALEFPPDQVYFFQLNMIPDFILDGENYV